MATDAQIRALVRRRLARHSAVEEKMRQPLRGLTETYLQIEEEELRREKWGRLSSLLAAIPYPKVPRLRHAGLAYTHAIPTFSPKGLAHKIVVAVTVAAVPIAALAWTQSTEVLKSLNRAIACAETTTLIGADGLLVGATPTSDEAICANYRFMVTAPFSAATTERLGAAVASIEGQFTVGSPYVWFGHDVRGFARKAGQMVGLLPGRGFSSPLLTSVEAAMGEHDLSPWRKLVMIVATSRFTAEALPDDASRAAFIVEHMPTVVRAGHPRAGLLGAHAIFGGEPRTTAEYCQLARAMGYAIWAIRDEVTPRAAQSWATSVGPGAAACVRALAPTPDAEAQAMSDLRAACGGTDLCISPPPLPPDVPEAMALRGLDDALVAIAKDRLPRFSPLSPPGNAQLVALDAMRLGGIERAGPHQTTLDTETQYAIDRSIDPELEYLDRRLPQEACLTGQCANRVDHTVLLAELVGDGNVALRALHVNRHGALTGWLQLDDLTGDWWAEPPRFGLGSTAKVIVLLAATQHGIERVCSNAVGGPDCRHGFWMSLRHAIAMSESEPFQWIAAQYPDEVAAVQQQLGAAQGEVVSNRSYDAAFGIGRSTMTPVEAVALFAAMLEDGQSTVRFFEDGPAVADIDLRAAGIDAEALAAARRVLDAPMVDDGGTLFAVGQMLREQGLTPVAAKSGTHSELGVNLVRTSTVAFATPNGRRFILHVSLTATDTTDGLGDLSHDDLVAIQRAVIDSLKQQ